MDKLRLGMIGTGGRGGLYEYWRQDPRVQVVAGADVNPAALAAFSKNLPAAFVTDDYRRVLDRKDVDAVAVCTPDFLHHEHAVAALAAGKHVFCEKPLAITIEDCDDILLSAQRAGVKIMVGFNMRYFAFVVKMKEIVDSGAIGQIRTAWTRHFVGWGGDFYFHDWHARRANTTGLLLQKASHDIDVMHWICGSNTVRTTAMGKLMHFGGDMPNDRRCPACADRLDCREAQPPGAARELCCFRREVDVEDVSLMLMEMGNGVLASYQQCHFAPKYERNYAFIGDEGMVESDELNNKVNLWRRQRGKTLMAPSEVIDAATPAGGHSGADPQITRDFVNVVLDGALPRAPAEAGRWSVAAGVCATQSLRSGGIPIDVPPLPPELR